MRKVLLLVAVCLQFSFKAEPVQAFQYPSITNPNLFPNSVVNDPQQNLIKNPWFVDTVAPVNICKSSFSPLDPLDPWKTSSLSVDPDDPTYGAPWGPSDKPQDPHYVNCFGDWTGYAARFARNSGQGENEFYDNKDAKLWQIVSADIAKRTLHFHALIVAHQVNTYKAEIYGCASASCPPGSGVLVWTPFNISCTNTSDCVNETYGSDYEGLGCNPHPTLGRDCLWEDVAMDLPANADNSTKLGLVPLQKTISQGFPFYRIQFLMNYPTHLPPPSSTGDVGGKLARVYFAVSGGGGGSPFPSPSPVNCTPAGDTNCDGHVTILDAAYIMSKWGTTDIAANITNSNGSGIVDFVDLKLLLTNFF